MNTYNQQASTESIMQALFALAQTANTPETPFTIMSRRMRHFKDVTPEEIPAFFQFQNPVRETTGGVRKLPKEIIGVSWFVYLPKSQSIDDVVSPALNNYYDALSNVLLSPIGGLPQTLGGLVTQCYKDGQGLTDEGLLDTPSLIHIPIKIITGI